MTDHTARPESWEEQETWCSAGNGIADCRRELRARVERLEERNKDELANWRTAAIRQCEIERRLVRLEHLASTTHFVLDTSAMPEAKREQLLQSLKEPGRVERLEQAQQQPEPEPADDEPLHTVALRMVDTLANLGLLPEITDTIRRAIREPMQPAPSTPAGQGELFDSVAAVMSESPTDVILAVADWLADKGAIIGPDLLRREVGR